MRTIVVLGLVLAAASAGAQTDSQLRELELKDLLGFLFQRQDATQTIWTFYSGAVALIAGLVTASKVEWLTVQVRVAITVLFLVFATTNFLALHSIHLQREALVKLAKETLKKDKSPQSDIERAVMAAKAPETWMVIAFHGSLDLAVLAAVWWIPLARRRSKTKRPQTA